MLIVEMNDTEARKSIDTIFRDSIIRPESLLAGG